MAQKIFRGGIDFRPPPGLRRYFRPSGRCRTGIRGSTFAQSSSDTSQDFICGILGHHFALTLPRIQYLFTDKLLEKSNQTEIIANPATAWQDWFALLSAGRMATR